MAMQKQSEHWRRGADLNVATNGATPVFMAVQKGHAEAISALAEGEADLNLTTNGGPTAVFIATQKACRCNQSPCGGGTGKMFCAIKDNSGQFKKIYFMTFKDSSRTLKTI